MEKTVNETGNEGRSVTDGLPRQEPGMITDEMVEVASEAYADAADYYLKFHRGLSSPSSDRIRVGVRAALTAALGTMKLKPVAWVIPGDNNAFADGSFEAMSWESGEFSKPLYAFPTPPNAGEAE